MVLFGCLWIFCTHVFNSFALWSSHIMLSHFHCWLLLGSTRTYLPSTRSRLMMTGRRWYRVLYNRKQHFMADVFLLSLWWWSFTRHINIISQSSPSSIGTKDEMRGLLGEFDFLIAPTLDYHRKRNPPLPFYVCYFYHLPDNCLKHSKCRAQLCVKQTMRTGFYARSIYQRHIEKEIPT